MRAIALLPAAAEPAPDGFDVVEHVSASLAAVPWGHEVEVVLDLPLEEARRRLPSTLATMAETDQGSLLRMQVGSLEWMAGVLAGLGCGFEIRSPDELRRHVRELARRLADLAQRPKPSRARRRESRP
jgi:predicted DNA-binding transcriptional regulator YafY